MSIGNLQKHSPPVMSPDTLLIREYTSPGLWELPPSVTFPYEMIVSGASDSHKTLCMSHLIHLIVENGHIKLANLFITSDYLNLVDPDRDNLISPVVLFPRKPDLCYQDQARPSCFKSNFDYISIKDSTESTPLLLAVQNFQAKIIRRLLAMGADSNQNPQHIGDPEPSAPRKMSNSIANFFIDISSETCGEWKRKLFAAERAPPTISRPYAVQPPSARDLLRKDHFDNSSSLNCARFLPQELFSKKAFQHAHTDFFLPGVDLAVKESIWAN
ncbi:hypothetical protein CCUS01_15295 [Colletotrichum cuscutae]|uniref:Ankyrin repeat protein n=1 Tax=Colletotrichum cuscutae TaxID=1209917 RepID=A0AAI9VE74_9PEZI|nr:hypothetical protein CCUS01_15295 [Colletotrichum cuscutae]